MTMARCQIPPDLDIGSARNGSRKWNGVDLMYTPNGGVNFESRNLEGCLPSVVLLILAKISNVCASFRGKSIDQVQPQTWLLTGQGWFRNCICSTPTLTWKPFQMVVLKQDNVFHSISLLLWLWIRVPPGQHSLPSEPAPENPRPSEVISVDGIGARLQVLHLVDLYAADLLALIPSGTEGVGSTFLPWAHDGPWVIWLTTWPKLLEFLTSEWPGAMSPSSPSCPKLQKLLLLNLPSAHPGLTAKVICNLAKSFTEKLASRWTQLSMGYLKPANYE